MPDATTRPWLCLIEGPDGWRCPAPSHDTYAAHRYGCRSRAAEQANRLYRYQQETGTLAPRHVDATGVRRRLQAVLLMGWSSAYVAREHGTSRQVISALLHGRWSCIQRDNRDRLIPLLERLAMQPAPFNNPTSRTRALARRRGYLPLLAWDDIDDPAETPPPAPDLTDQVRELASRGYSVPQIATKLDVSNAVARKRLEWAGPVAVELEPQLLDRAAEGRYPFAELSEPEKDVVVERLLARKRAEGFDTPNNPPGPQVAEVLGIDYATVDRIHDRVRQREWYRAKNEEAS